jgi:hypothetical protein
VYIRPIIPGDEEMLWKNIESADTIALIISVIIGVLIISITNLFIFGVP